MSLYLHEIEERVVGSTLISVTRYGDSIAIVTSKGTLTGRPVGDCCSIWELRNESNGYYGGWLEWDWLERDE